MVLSHSKPGPSQHGHTHNTTHPCLLSLYTPQANAPPFPLFTLVTSFEHSRIRRRPVLCNLSVYSQHNQHHTHTPISLDFIFVQCILGSIVSLWPPPFFFASLPGPPMARFLLHYGSFPILYFPLPFEISDYKKAKSVYSVSS
ncbi:hypothetical protein M413DRAFT_99927 [Hebeloma cylindrosporum]|uniref:Uncharacterized protein n=1 Tax=Hebeloma cylindrosporum TaxID=76867 RepID=A0A0C3CZE6_HEBCY|nr:hypothetical protein M413DRAFT_99927 [Hebeloma cylindrosporum h7]